MLADGAVAIRASGKPAPNKPKELTIRTATWLITSHPDRQEESGMLKLKKLLARCPELDAVAACVRSFAAMMTERRGNDLAGWLTSAENTGLKPLCSLARGLRQDFDAVTAGLTLDWIRLRHLPIAALAGTAEGVSSALTEHQMIKREIRALNL
ncbi:hypothetical protein AB0M29_35235 [Streptomyces sp. NPDC051976]|uniref:hypothetical protein n=1 Tax=Streptomyces sp. NPDC051976 TaxID=3154947 RepID=UPI003423C9AB